MYMIIDSEIVERYLAGDDIEKYKDRWYYKIEDIKYSVPDYDEKKKQEVKYCYDELIRELNGFVPCNISIWNAIFPDWKEIISKVHIYLIVGFPNPYDAVTIKSQDGLNIIFDLLQWTKYIKSKDMKKIARNLLTHELCHACIETSIPDISHDTGDYSIRLDATTFNEGFAHLLSYESSDIGNINWNDEKLKSVSEKSRQIMKRAIGIKSASEQKKYLNRAVCGSYYDKFACMCGMFYLAECYEKGGLEQLKKIFEKGYKGFAAITIDRKFYYNAYDERYKEVHMLGLQWADSSPSPIVQMVINNLNISKHDKILEIGCGEGRDSADLISKGYDAYGSDVSSEAVKYCSNKYKSDRFFVLDAVNGQLEQKYDFIYCIAVLHMLVPDEDRMKFLSFIKNHLNKGGHALICSMGDGNHESASDISHSYDKVKRVHEETNTKVNITSTSCRIVKWDKLNEEFEEADFKIVREGIVTDTPGFNSMMYIVAQ